MALLFGGRSGEHAISAATAAGVLKAIDREKYDVIPVGITRDGQWVVASDDPAVWELRSDRLPEVTAASGSEVVLSSSSDGPQLQVLEAGSVPSVLAQVDVVFPVLHGPFGEDGTVQGLLELADVRYVGSGVLASAVGMDKHYMKLVFAAHDLPVGPYVVVTPRDWSQRREDVLTRVKGLRLPVFVKPARAGSSLGRHPGRRPRRPRAGGRGRAGARPQGARGGGHRGPGDRVRRAGRSRRRRAARVGPRRDRGRPRGARVLRLRGQVHRRGAGPARRRPPTCLPR